MRVRIRTDARVNSNEVMGTKWRCLEPDEVSEADEIDARSKRLDPDRAWNSPDERQARTARQLYFEGLAAGLATRGKALIMSIENGTDTDLIDLRQYLMRLAAKEPEQALFLQQLDTLVARGDEYVPTAGIVPSYLTREEAYQIDGSNANEPWVWGLRMGFARDRVMAYSRVKAALLDRDNVTIAAEVDDVLKSVYSRAQSRLRETEKNLKKCTGKNLEDPFVSTHVKRTKWARVAQHIPGAMRQHPSLLQLPVLQGLSSNETTALALDPRLALKDTIKAAAEANHTSHIGRRDLKIGTEFYISLTFPSMEHAELVAAGAQGASMGVGPRNAVHTPALVTMHLPTGCICDFLPGADGERAPNAFFTSNAAEVLSEVHTLCHIANQALYAKEAASGFQEFHQRDWLYLEHDVR